MRLSNSRYEDIKKDIVKMYVDANINTFPIDVFYLCERLGYVCKSYSSLGGELAIIISSYEEDGFHLFEEGKVVIYYNDSKVEGRIRFTIMHEIGHVIRKHFVFSPLAENEADWFAAYSLCPPPIVDLYEVSDSSDLITMFNLTSDCAYNSMNRYITWKKRNAKLTDLEKFLINQFSIERK